MAKKTISKEKTKAIPLLPSNHHVGSFGQYVIWTDGKGAAWCFNLEDGTAQPVTFGKDPR